MNTMSIDQEKKLQAIRKAEHMTQIEFAKELGIGLGTVKNYEAGIRGVGLFIINKVTNHPIFSKYTLWLMTNKIAPEVGQIEPAFSLSGSKVLKKKEQQKSCRMMANGC